MANGRTRIVGGLLVAIVACAFGASASAAPARDNPPTDRFIVKFKDGSREHDDAVARRRLVETAGVGQGLHLGKTRRLAVGADLVVVDRKLDAKAAQAFMRKLRNDPRVEYVQVDKRMHALFTPNDTQYPSQWNYLDPTAGIGAPAAWDVATGSGVVVAVVDSGFTDHVDLSANLVPGYDFISADGPSDFFTANDGDGRDANAHDPGDWVAAGDCGPGSSAQDSSWHGTHVAGTVAAVTNNARGVAGIAFNARVQPVRALGRCGGFTSDIADAIVWASGGAVSGVPANATPAEVINLSIGNSGGCDPATQQAIDVAVGNGAVIVAAAGNDAADAGGFSPASCDHVVTVAATNNSGGRTGYTNFGDAVDLAAPGGNSTVPILSTLNAGKTGPDSQQIYAGAFGTSVAGAHVAAVAALMQSHVVNTPSMVETILTNSARAFPAACVGCGSGLLTAPAAIAYADAPFLYIDGPATVVEGDAGTRLAVFSIRLSKPVANSVFFRLRPADDTAKAGSDYVANSCGASWPAGVTFQECHFEVLGDTEIEPTEKFKVVLTDIVGATALQTTSTATIVNDDGPVLQDGVPLGPLSAPKGAQTLYEFNVPANATSLTFATSGQTGDADIYVRRALPPTLNTWDDYSAGVGSIEQVVVDQPQSGTWYVLVHAAAAYTDVTLTASYEGGDPQPATNLSVNDVTVVEGTNLLNSRFLTFTVSLSQASPVPVTVHVDTADGTADTSDYSFDGRDITIPAGTLSKWVNVRINDDTNPEPLEYFYLYLTNATNANITDNRGTGYIINDDGALISINDVAVGEGNAGTKVMTFTVSLSKAAPGPVSYDIYTQGGDATAGVDYQALNLTNQVIPQGQLSKTHTVVINGDTAVEPTEVLLAYVRNPVGASVWDGQGTGYILNDDGPTLSILDASVAEGNSGTKVMTFNVALSQAAAGPVTFDVASANGVPAGWYGGATAGSDYTALNLTGQTIPAGQTSKTIQVTISGDTDVEPNETFTLTLSNPSGATLYDRQAIGFIYNDDGPTLSVSDATISEGNSGQKLMTFTVFLSEPNQGFGADEHFSVSTSNVTATAGSDYVATTITDAVIPQGQLAKTFTVPINGDTAVEGNETFRVTLSKPTPGLYENATFFKYIGTGTITNDD